MKKSQSTNSLKKQENKPVLNAKRIGPSIIPDRSHVLIRAFSAGNKTITDHIISRILKLSEKEVSHKLQEIMTEFKDRHLNIEKTFNNRYEEIREYVNEDFDITEKQKTLIGAYFCHEYSPESAALLNPSIIFHPDQTNLPNGSTPLCSKLESHR
jgi:hypothetical protein